jgi:hypothetical protein
MQRYLVIILKTLPFSLIAVILIIRGCENLSNHQTGSGLLQLITGVGIAALFVVFCITRKSRSRY